jgi:GDP-D-mannose dehydratase
VQEDYFMKQKPASFDEVRLLFIIMLISVRSNNFNFTGKTHTVREFVKRACQSRNDYCLAERGNGGTREDQATGKVRVEIDPRYFRPAEVELLIMSYDLIYCLDISTCIRGHLLYNK